MDGWSHLSELVIVAGPILVQEDKYASEDNNELTLQSYSTKIDYVILSQSK